jgi:Arc/MetJ-type ribon-helix-helix transcriptional regulator
VPSQKIEHLRVRLSSEQRSELEATIQSRGQGETLSDIVREAITFFLAQGDTQGLHLDEACRAMLEELAREVDRSPQRVAEDCVGGIYNYLRDELPPLIVEEIKLRRRYQSLVHRIRPKKDSASDKAEA